MNSVLGRKHCGKRRKCWLPAFSPFSHNVFKSLHMCSRENQGLFGKGLDLTAVTHATQRKCCLKTWQEINILSFSSMFFLTSLKNNKKKKRKEILLLY